MESHVRRSLASVSAVGLTAMFAHMVEATPPVWGTSYQNYTGKPAISVPVTYHDFTPAGQPGGHADFGKGADLGPGRYIDIAGSTLDASGKPVYLSTGHKVLSDWKDATAHNIISPRPYIDAVSGDSAGSKDSAAGGAVTSAATFGQWFKDVPGVNTTTSNSMAFAKIGNNYVFDGTLDGFKGGTPDYSYTSEISYYFTYEEGNDWFIDLNTGAEAWVYIDGKLVLDGGGAGGGAVNFTIANGIVTVTEPFAAEITVLGAAMSTTGMPGFPLPYTFPVTPQAKVGGVVVHPFFANGFTKPATGGNVNDNKNPRTAILTASAAAGTTISVQASSWFKTSTSSSGLLDSHFTKILTVDSATGSANVKVLRNGDPVPNITPFQNQATIVSFLQPYLNPVTHKVTLGQNQVIYLYELATTDLSQPYADFQDVVVLLNFAKNVSGLPPVGINMPPPPVSGGGGSAPALSQRVSIDRLNWLTDKSTHRVQIFYANRSGSATNFRMETNIRTLNIANRYVVTEND